MLPDRLLVTKTIERTLTYNVVTKEFKVATFREARVIHTTRDLRDAQRVLSDIRGVKMMPAATLDPAAVIYVRVHAAAASSQRSSRGLRPEGSSSSTTLPVFARMSA